MAVSDPTHYYVDPSLGSDTGDGTVGTPWGRASGSVVQYALDTITRDTTNGDQINLKAGATDTLTAALSFATYGAPTATAQVTIRGYTSAANDGGIGVIDGDLYAVWVGLEDYTVWADLDITSDVATTVFGNTTANWGHWQNLYFHDISNRAAILGWYGRIVNCRFESCNTGNSAVPVLQLANPYGKIHGSYFLDCHQRVIHSTGAECRITHNIISDAAGEASVYAIQLASSEATAYCNSIFSAGGTGVGIHNSNYLGFTGYNLVEGFSGTGGDAFQIDWTGSGGGAGFVYNSYYNNDTDVTYGANAFGMPLRGSNESLGASPFAKSGANTYANRATFFEPQDTGSVLSGLNGMPRGAVPVAGGGAATNIIMRPRRVM